MAVMSLVLGLLTEELFFRGWLFGALRRVGLNEINVMVWTGVAFSLWHIPAVTMDTQDALPLAQIPVLLVNGVAIGAMNQAGMKWMKLQLGYTIGLDPGVYADEIQAAKGAGFKVLLSILGNPNDLAMNMVTFLPLAVTIAMSRHHPGVRRLMAGGVR